MKRHEAQTISSVCEHQVRVFGTRRRQIREEFVGISDHLGFRPAISFRQFSPHGVEAEFGQSSFHCVRSYRLIDKTDHFARVVIFHVATLVLGAFIQIWISASFRL